MNEKKLYKIVVGTNHFVFWGTFLSAWLAFILYAFEGVIAYLWFTVMFAGLCLLASYSRKRLKKIAFKGSKTK